ncbi:MAG: ATP-binding protein [Cellvibrionaceae bacterium]
MLRSLTSRFIFASLLTLPILLGLSVFGLNSSFQTSLLSGEREKLKTHIYLLLGAAEVSSDSLWMPEQFQEPRLNQVESGLYGVIHDGNNHEVWRSPSAKLRNLEQPLKDKENTALTPGKDYFSNVNLDSEQFFIYSQDILWEIESNQERHFRFSIIHSQKTFQAESNAYKNQIWKWLGIFVACILLAQVVILRWGLKPLKNLAVDLKKMESNESIKLEGIYPSEIQPVTDNLNHVIYTEQKQRERYRTTLDDLAHSLKTPLSVIQSSIENNSSANNSFNKDNDYKIIGDQIERMNQIVQHQLQRAVIGHSKTSTNKVNISSTVERITESLKKVYREKNITLSVDIDSALTFSGDERDVFELLGNIIENAFKYSNKRIKICGTKSKNGFILAIEDDGEGIPEEKRELILKRGERIDTIKPGQGIGLSVAIDIISSYNGSLEVEQSPLGGASFKISLPNS